MPSARSPADGAGPTRTGPGDLPSAPPLGNVTVENRNGSVNVTVPEQAGFTVQAETTNGDLENDFSLPTEGSDNRKNFGGTVGKGGSLIRLTTTQADVSLKKASVAPLPPAPPPPPPLSRRDSRGSRAINGKSGRSGTSGPRRGSHLRDHEGLPIHTR